jgi:uncharacterized protein YjiS (DUF1127 family)
MSTFLNALAAREAPAGTSPSGIGTTLRTWWSAYINWRLQQLAVSRLRSMSNRELKDIGVARAEIDFVVAGGVDRHPMLTRYY